MSEKLPPAPPTFEHATPAMELFMEKHFKSVLIGLGVVVLALAGYAWMRYSAQQTENAAGAAFVAAKTEADYDVLIQKYPGTEAAGNALLMKADRLWQDNKKDSSVKELKTFVAQHEDHPFYPAGLLGLASKLAAMGERTEAQPLFERIVNDMKASALAPEAQIRLGDLLWAEGKVDEAKQAYEAVPVKFPEAHEQMVEESKTRLKWIAANLPTKEVDGPPKPKAPEPAPGAVPTPGAPMAPPQFNIPGLSPTVQPPSAPGASSTEGAPMLQVPSPSQATPSAAPASPGVTTPAPTLPPPAVMPAPTAAPTPAPATTTTAPAAPMAAPAPAPAAPTPPSVPAATTPAPAGSDTPPAAAPAPSAPDAPKAP